MRQSRTSGSVGGGGDYPGLPDLFRDLRGKVWGHLVVSLRPVAVIGAHQK